MQQTFEQVAASYQRCRKAGDFFEAFYIRFLAKSPEIPVMFSRTDFVRQKRMLKQSLFELLSYFQDPDDSSVAEIEKLGARHRGMNVARRHYELWLDALVETVAEFDAQQSESLLSAWRESLLPGIEAMIEASSDDQSVQPR